MLNEYVDIRRKSLINTYIGSQDRPDDTNHIFLLFEFSGSKEFIEYEGELTINKLYVDSYDPDKYHVMYIFKVPKKHQNVYDLFKEGKYSEFPQAYKIALFEFHGIKNPTHRVAQVLFKHPDLREEWENKLNIPIPEDSEVSSVPDLESEIYSNKYKYVNPVKPQKNPFD
tara:strand:+ start:4561 stop:5070 length:510 start_codon:yes stop_codon:yes gene_type:complete